MIFLINRRRKLRESKLELRKQAYWTSFQKILHFDPRREKNTLAITYTIHPLEGKIYLMVSFEVVTSGHKMLLLVAIQ